MTLSAMDSQSSSKHILRHVVQGSEIPISEDLLAIVDERTASADVRAIQKFMDAAKAVTNLPSYRELRRVAQTEKHCVRCHTTYTEENNTAGSCLIPHVFDSDPESAGRTFRGCEVHEYRADCCDTVTLKEEGSGDWAWLNSPEPCFEGFHTSDATTVADVEGYNGVSIVPCSPNSGGRCTLECQKYLKQHPVFH